MLVMLAREIRSDMRAGIIWQGFFTGKPPDYISAARVRTLFSASARSAAALLQQFFMEFKDAGRKRLTG